MEKRWSKTEIAHLKRHAESQSLEELAQRFHTDTDTVRRKLQDLKLVSAEAADDTDDALKRYEEGLRLLYDSKWKEAEEIFSALVGDADHPQIADRARQFTELCRQRTGSSPKDVDPYDRAVFEKNRGNLDEARKLAKKLAKVDDDERSAYLMASIEALDGADDRALELLETAIRLEPKNRVHAYHDPDFETIRGSEEFAGLIAAGR